MSNENYKLLSDKLDSFRKDVDDKMVTKGMLIAAVIIPLTGINLAFLVMCAITIIDIWQK